VRRILRGAGWASVAAGVALVAAGTAGGVRFRSEMAAIHDAPPGTPWLELSGHYDRADTYRQLFYAGTITGAVLAVGGAVALVLGARRAELAPALAPRLTLAPFAGPDGAGCTLRRTF
jgi:hypothetical protein